MTVGVEATFLRDTAHPPYPIAPVPKLLGCPALLSHHTTSGSSALWPFLALPDMQLALGLVVVRLLALGPLALPR